MRATENRLPKTSMNFRTRLGTPLELETEMKYPDIEECENQNSPFDADVISWSSSHQTRLQYWWSNTTDNEQHQQQHSRFVYCSLDEVRQTVKEDHSLNP